MAQNVANILGIPLEMAENLLAAAGGDEALAIDLGLSGGVDAATLAPAAPSFTLPYPQYTQIWPEAKELPTAWAEQRLDEVRSHTTDQLVQRGNGPCGVLAVVQAELWIQDDTTVPFSERLTKAIASILSRLNTPQLTFADGTQHSVVQASQTIRTAAALVETLALSSSSSSPPAILNQPLVEGPNWLCSADLMCLLLRGYIGKGNFRAYDDDTKIKVPFYNNNNNNNTTPLSLIGFLSYSELEEGIPVADDLKLNKKVWVVHTGDHFVTMRQTSDTTLQIYDGLPPAGPICTTYRLSGDLSPPSPLVDKFVETFTKKRPGQPDDIVQAKKTDSSSYQDWTFEVVPAVDDPTVEGTLDDDPEEPIYNFATLPYDSQSPWRCATCYHHRFQTMCFGQNSEGGDICSNCEKARRTALWSLWQSFAELSPRMKQRARRMYAPRLELVLATRWPKATLVAGDRV